MARVLTMLCFFCLSVSGCGRTGSTAQDAPEATEKVRTVTLTSHLHGDLNSDPTLKIGERIQIVPDESEPFMNHDPVDVMLPNSAPYDGKDQIYFLRGYAVGQSSYTNGHIACHSNTSAARQHKSWNDGWDAGFREREVKFQATPNRAG